ncbi:MAG: domain nuclease [Ignavibacteria bacterium]|nr:domain nuclease [Ignavibacteria bacterium]
MILLDSNIIIYSIYPKSISLRDFIFNNDCLVSDISVVETLGFYKIEESEKNYLINFFGDIPTISIDKSIINAAIECRQSKKMTLGDSIIAATAKSFKLKLATKNIKDFSGLGIEVFDPMIEGN